MSDTSYTSTTTHGGDMRCHTVYTPYEGEFTTDVPSALGGKGVFPTPGCMLASCVASCMLSMISFTGKNKGFETKGISIDAAAQEGGSGIKALHFHVRIPMPVTPETRRRIEAAVTGCPVGRSISSDIEKKISWDWAE